MDSNLTVRISANDGASVVFNKVAGSAKTMGDAVEQVGKSGSGLDTLADRVKGIESEITTVGTALTGFGAAGVAAFGVAANSSIQFHASMANVNSIARLSAGEMSSLEASVLGVAQQFGAVPDELSSALYDIVSSGFEASEAMGILEASTVAAGAGLTSTATATQAITAVLNAYRLDATEAGNVSDILFKTVDSGVITFEELAGSLGRVLPVASSLGVSVEELGAAYATLTLQGISASESETGVAAVMTTALNPTTALKEAVTAYGYASAEAIIKSQGLSGYLEFLAQASGGSSAKMSELTGNVRATNAALALGVDGGALYADSLTQMNTAASDGQYTLEVFGIQMDTTAGSIKKLGAEASVAAIGIGSSLEPLVRMGVDAAGGLLSAFNSLPGPVQQTITLIGAFGSAATLAAGTMLLMIPKIVQFQQAMVAIGGARGAIGLIAAAANPAALALGALAVAGIYTWSIFKEGRDASQGLEDALTSLGDVAENLRLGHRDQEAQFVDDFRADVEAIEELAPRMAQAQIDALGGPDGGFQGDYYEEVGRIREEYELSTEEAEKYAAAQVEIGAMFADSRINAAGLNSTLDSLWAQWQTGAITADEYVNNLIWVTENQDKYRVAAEGSVDSSAEAAAAMEAEAAEADKLAESISALVDQLYEVSGIDDPLSRFTLSGQASEFAEIANSVLDAGTALETVFRVVVGNTDAISQQVQGVNDWADELIGVQGEYGIIDDLLRLGVINQQEYNAAQQAQVSIRENAFTVEQSINTIQAMQAPLIAEHTAALSDQLLLIRDMPAEQQLIALGWMDATTAGRAMEFQTLAIAAASGELGTHGEAAFSAMITGAAQADPVLAALLEDMGLISQGADGTITINMPGADEAISDLDRIQMTLVDLIDILDNGKLDGSYTLDVGMTINGDPIVGDGTGGAGSGGSSVEDIVRRHFGEEVIPVDAPVEVTPVVTQATPSTGDGTGGAPNVEQIVRDIFGEDVIPVDVPVEAHPDMSVVGEGATGSFDTIGGYVRHRIRAMGDVETPEPVEVEQQIYVGPQLSVVGEDVTGSFDTIGGFVRHRLRAMEDFGDPEPIEMEQQINVSLAYAIGGDVAGGGQSALDAMLGELGDDQEVTISVNAEDNASQKLDLVRGLADQIDGAQAFMGVNANDAASPKISGARAALGAVDGATALLRMLGNNDSALGSIGAARGALGAADGTTALLRTLGNNDSALGSISVARGALGAVDGASALMSVQGNNSDALNKIGQIQAYNGVTLSTAYHKIQTIHEDVFRTIGGRHGRLHGGLAGYAVGGITAELAEAGPEMLHFAGGGTALIPQRGIYADIPPSTYVSPANAIRSVESYRRNYDDGAPREGDIHVAVTVQGSVMTADDLAETVSGKIAPVIRDAARERQRGQGVYHG